MIKVSQLEGPAWVAIWPLKGQISLIWPFLKQFSRNKMIWPFFNLEENGIFLGLFWLNFNETSNILWYFKISLTYFGRFSLKIWPIFGLFHHLRIWPFLKLLMAKFGLFYFLGPGNPVFWVSVVSGQQFRVKKRLKKTFWKEIAR